MKPDLLDYWILILKIREIYWASGFWFVFRKYISISYFGYLIFAKFRQILAKENVINIRFSYSLQWNLCIKLQKLSHDEYGLVGWVFLTYSRKYLSLSSLQDKTIKTHTSHTLEGPLFKVVGTDFFWWNYWKITYVERD